MNYRHLLVLLISASISLSLAAATTPIASQDQMDIFLKSNTNAVVEFSNPLCGACQAFHKSGGLNKLARRYPKAAFGVITSDSLQDAYNIKQTPTFILFVNKAESNRIANNNMQELITFFDPKLK